MKVINIDLGSSWVKMQYYNGDVDEGYRLIADREKFDKTVIYEPSFVKFEEFDSSSGGDNGDIVFSGYKFTCGKNSLNSSNLKPKEANSYHHFHISVRALALVCHCVESMGVKGKVDHLIYSLPDDLAKNEEWKEELRLRLSSLNYQVIKNSVLEERAIEVESKVMIVPQGYGAFKSFEFENRVYNRINGKFVAVFDIGSITTDCLFLKKIDEKYQYIPSSTRSIRSISSNNFFQFFKKDIQKMTSEELRLGFYDVFEKIIAKDYSYRTPTGTFLIEKNIREALIIRKNEITQKFSDEVDLCLGDYRGEVDTILLTGGGANLIDTKNESIWKHPNGITHKSSEWANLKGQLLIVFEYFHKEAENSRLTDMIACSLNRLKKQEKQERLN